MEKSVLLISYYWPPSGGPGVQRVLKFAKYLPKFGYKPIILTVENGEYSQTDESLLNDIPKECIVYKTNTIEPFGLYKAFTKKNKNASVPTEFKNANTKEKYSNLLRANVLLPDARLGWIPFIVSEGKKIIQQHKPEFIFCSSPPHSSQLGAITLSKITKTKLISDFRDPWIKSFWLTKVRRFKLAEKLDSFFEKRVATKTNAVITVSKNIANYFSKFSDNVNIIANGYDEDDFESITKTNSQKFRITYTGNISNSQNPETLIKVINNLIQNDNINKSEICIDFWGTVSYQSTLEKMDTYKLCNYNSYISHSECIKKMINSELLLLLIPKTKDNKGILTGKLFEYLRSGNPILGLGPKDGDASAILQETGNGVMFDYDENNQISKFILDKFHIFKNNIENGINNPKVEKYSRKKQTEQLVNIFEELK